jgi:hypothetical protein
MKLHDWSTFVTGSPTFATTDALTFSLAVGAQGLKLVLERRRTRKQVTIVLRLLVIWYRLRAGTSRRRGQRQRPLGCRRLSEGKPIQSSHVPATGWLDGFLLQKSQSTRRVQVLGALNKNNSSDIITQAVNKSGGIIEMVRIGCVGRVAQ